MPFSRVNYRGGLWSVSGHLETILRSYVPPINHLPTDTETLELSDNDFVELEWYVTKKQKLIILTHGLEGSARSGYIVQLAHALNLAGYDVLAWSMRGCGAQLNRLPRAYHSGETGDLNEVVQHAAAQGYKHIGLVGFSLGGNITVKYMGEHAKDRPEVFAGFAISVPLDLFSAARKLLSPRNVVYHQYFLHKLKNKLKRKAAHHPELKLLLKKHIRTLIDFDDLYTGPIHGFEGAEDYYEKNSGNRFLNHIRKPTFILNAENDPLLSPECFPEALTRQHEYVHFYVVKKGGHVAFSMDTTMSRMFHIEWILKHLQALSC